MNYGFNISMRHSRNEILELGKLLLKTNEFQAIEVTYSEHMRHIDTTSYNQAIFELADMYNPKVLVHISDFNLSEENIILQNAILAEFENCCKYIKAFNGHEIIMHCGSRKLIHISIRHEDGTRQTHGEVYKKMWKLSVETMKKACQIAAKYNILVYTENLSDNMLIQNAEQLQRYIRDVDEKNLYIVYDTGHGHLTSHNVSDEILKCNKWLRHLHLHDNHGSKDEHLAVGAGTIDWRSFCKALKDVNYQGICMMELYHSTYDELVKSKEILMRYL